MMSSLTLGCGLGRNGVRHHHIQSHCNCLVMEVPAMRPYPSCPVQLLHQVCRWRSWLLGSVPWASSDTLPQEYSLPSLSQPALLPRSLPSLNRPPQAFPQNAGHSTAPSPDLQLANGAEEGAKWPVTDSQQALLCQLKCSLRLSVPVFP